jgi:site-specific DNA-adenine methylase
MSMPGSKRRMIGKLWPKIPRPRLVYLSEDDILSDLQADRLPRSPFRFSFGFGGPERTWRDGRFIVPFFGTGVDSGHFVNEGYQVVASDVHSLLVSMHWNFRNVIERSRAWLEVVEPLPVETQKIAYFKLRDRHREDPQPWSLYTLGKHAHSQLIRHNRKGEYNAPFGELRKMPTAEVVAAHVKFIESIDGPRVMDFASAMQAAQTGDVVYLDPPYYKTFNGYTGQPFDTPRLLAEIATVRDRGIAGAMSNSPAVLPLLEAHGLIVGDGVEVYSYTRAGTITVAMNERQPVAEVLVVWEVA